MRILIAILLIAATPLLAKEKEPNWWLDVCIEETNFKETKDWNKLSTCTSKLLNKQQLQKHANLRDFIKANPRYRYPGQSLNRCFGKDKEMPFKSVNSSIGPNGWEVTVTYKDRIKKCYQTSGWDNRDVGQ